MVMMINSLNFLAKLLLAIMIANEGYN